MDEKRNATEFRFKYLDRNTVETTIKDTETGIELTTIGTLPEQILQLSESELAETFRNFRGRVKNLLEEQLENGTPMRGGIGEWLQLEINKRNGKRSSCGSV